MKGCVTRQEGPIWSREAGGGRNRRQPGQVRKEAALTILGSGRSPVSFWLERLADGFRSPLAFGPDYKLAEVLRIGPSSALALLAKVG